MLRLPGEQIENQPPKGIPTERFEQVEVKDISALRDWLADNHAREEGVWLVTYKKSRPEHFVDRWDVLDELLCFGWIDGIRRKLDDDRTMQLITPRRMQAWAQSYKDRAARLIEQERMQPPGYAAIEQSKKSGLWNATQAVDALEMPEDVTAVLSDKGDALAWFEGAAPSYRRNILRWIASAAKPETRAKRIEKLVEFCAAGRKIPNY